MADNDTRTTVTTTAAGNTPRQIEKNLTVPTLHKLAWGAPAEIQMSLHELYAYAEKRADDAIKWYMRQKGKKALGSRALRLSAIILTTLGGLAPIIVSLGWLSTATGRLDRSGAFHFTDALVGQLGYLLLAIAGACILLDKFFGFSSGWMRYITTGMSIQKSLSQFRLDWAMMVAQLGGKNPTPDQVQLMITRLREFVALVDSEVEMETKAWITEFQNNLADLDRSVKEQTAAQRPGAVDVTVTNGMEATEGFAVALDGMTVATVRGTKYQIGSVPPGPHKVSITGMVKGKSLDASELVVVPPGDIGKATLAFPIETGQTT